MDRDVVVGFRVDPKTRVRLVAAAMLSGRTLSAWVRDILRDAAEREIEHARPPGQRGSAK